jgi:O-antigen/teichoic acid export membrane protein
VVREAAFAFFSRSLSAVAAFLVTVVVARRLGADGAGIYFLCLATVGMVSLFARLGLDHVVLRSIAAHSSRNEWGAVRRSYTDVLTTVVLTSAVLTLAFYLGGAHGLSWLLGKPSLEPALKVMVLGLLPFSLLFIFAEVFKAEGRSALSQFIQGGLASSLMLMLLVVSAWPGTAEHVAGLYVCAWACAVMVVIALRALIAGTYPADQSTSDRAAMWRSAKTLFRASLLRNGFALVLPILISLWVSERDVGLYGAALRIAVLTSFVLIALNSVVAPRFASAYSLGDHKMLADLARRSSTISAVVAVPIVALLAVFSRPIMGAFGAEFAAAAPYLCILLVGQLTNALTGSVGFLLTMTGHERDLQKAVFQSTVLGILLLLLLTPKLGVLGGAIAFSFNLFWQNIGAAVYAYRRLNILCLPSFRLATGREK